MFISEKMRRNLERGRKVDLPKGGLISYWKFAEGSGTAVKDEWGANPLNLSTPTSPNTTWTSAGLAVAAGLIQTPSIAGARTVAIFYKTTRASTGGFLISGGASSGAGVLQDTASTLFSYQYGGGWGVHPLRYRASSGGAAYELNRGGYGVLFQEFDQAYTTILGLGGRHSTTTSRCDNFEVVAAAVWNKQLSTAERAQAYNHWRQLGKSRGVYLNWRDCPTTVKTVMLGGESTADGRAKLVEMTAPQQAQIFTKTKIIVGNATTQGSSFATFTLGTNQQQTAPTTDFGPEVGIAQQIELGSATNYIIKLGQGTTYLSPSLVLSGTTPNALQSWNVNELPTGGGEFASFMREIYDADQSARSGGVGLDVRGIQFLIGLNDSTNTAFTGNSSATYQGYIQGLYDAIGTYTGLTGLKVHMPRAHNHDPAKNATANGQVRQGQADFITALGSLGQLQDTDALTCEADAVHFNGASNLTIGAAGYSFLLAA